MCRRTRDAWVVVRATIFLSSCAPTSIGLRTASQNGSWRHVAFLTTSGVESAIRLWRAAEPTPFRSHPRCCADRGLYVTERIVTDYAGVSPAEYASLAQVVRSHHGLDDIFAWGRQQSPPV